MIKETWGRLLAWFGVRRSIHSTPIEDGGDTWYTVRDAAELMGVSRQRVHELIGLGRLATKPMGRLLLISKASIDNLPNTKRRGGKHPAPLDSGQQ